jgi:hypothetical protein
LARLLGLLVASLVAGHESQGADRVAVVAREEQIVAILREADGDAAGHRQ